MWGVQTRGGTREPGRWGLVSWTWSPGTSLCDPLGPCPGSHKVGDWVLCIKDEQDGEEAEGVVERRDTRRKQSTRTVGVGIADLVAGDFTL